MRTIYRIKSYPINSYNSQRTIKKEFTNEMKYKNYLNELKKTPGIKIIIKIKINRGFWLKITQENQDALL